LTAAAVDSPPIPPTIARMSPVALSDDHHRAVARAGAAQPLELAPERGDRRRLDARVDRGGDLEPRLVEQHVGEVRRKARIECKAARRAEHRSGGGAKREQSCSWLSAHARLATFGAVAPGSGSKRREQQAHRRG
jgi:hypothetical protein